MAQSLMANRLYHFRGKVVDVLRIDTLYNAKIQFF
jgi:hypothetical protein